MNTQHPATRLLALFDQLDFLESAQLDASRAAGDLSRSEKECERAGSRSAELKALLDARRTEALVRARNLIEALFPRTGRRAA